MTYKETNQLIERYLDGLATPEEEQRLALEVAKADAPDEWKIIAAMLGELTTDEAIYDLMMAERECSANTSNRCAGQCRGTTSQPQPVSSSPCQ